MLFFLWVGFHDRAQKKSAACSTEEEKEGTAHSQEKVSEYVNGHADNKCSLSNKSFFSFDKSCPPDRCISVLSAAGPNETSKQVEKVQFSLDPTARLHLLADTDKKCTMHKGTFYTQSIIHLLLLM